MNRIICGPVVAGFLLACPGEPASLGQLTVEDESRNPIAEAVVDMTVRYGYCNSPSNEILETVSAKTNREGKLSVDVSVPNHCDGVVDANMTVTKYGFHPLTTYWERGEKKVSLTHKEPCASIGETRCYDVAYHRPVVCNIDNPVACRLYAAVVQTCGIDGWSGGQSGTEVCGFCVQLSVGRVDCRGEPCGTLGDKRCRNSGYGLDSQVDVCTQSGWSKVRSCDNECVQTSERTAECQNSACNRVGGTTCIGAWLGTCQQTGWSYSQCPILTDCARSSLMVAHCVAE